MESPLHTGITAGKAGNIGRTQTCFISSRNLESNETLLSSYNGEYKLIVLSDKVKWRSFLVGKTRKDVKEGVSYKLSCNGFGGKVPGRERRETEQAMG